MRIAISVLAWLSAALPAAAQETVERDFTSHPLGYVAVAIFIAAYVLVVFEETTGMRKSKPVLLAAGLIWLLIGLVHAEAGAGGAANEAASHVILEYGELFLFLLVAITYVNTLEERRIFDVLRGWLIGLGLSYRQLFWITGLFAFFLSSVLDNLTTVLVMGAVTLSIGRDARPFLVVSCIALVVAANAGGAFSPFGDITTLMVWQKDKLAFFEFFDLFLPSLVNYLIPAALMSFAIPGGAPPPHRGRIRLKPGAVGVVILFAATIVTAVTMVAAKRRMTPTAPGLRRARSRCGGGEPPGTANDISTAGTR